MARLKLGPSNTDVLHSVVRIDMQITLGLNVEVNLTVPGNLIKHMLEERYPRIKGAQARTVEAQLNADRVSRVSRLTDALREPASADSCFLLRPTRQTARR